MERKKREILDEKPEHVRKSYYKPQTDVERYLLKFSRRKNFAKYNQKKKKKPTPREFIIDDKH